MSAAGSGRPLPPGLSWALAGAPAPAEPAACRFGLSDVAAEDFGKGRYEVVHYGPAAYGLAFGPLSLGQVVRFCQELTAKLQLHEHVVFQHGPTTAERANCAVLLGAFLVMCKGWSADMVAEALPSEARLGFVCSWAQPTKVQQTPVMHVRDCWDGLELAGSRGWLRIGAWQAGAPEDAHLQAQLVDLAVSQYSRLALQYDACWLVPAEVLVMADPVTTIKDPNPSTCPSLGPPVRATEEQDSDEDLEPNSPVSEGSMRDMQPIAPVPVGTDHSNLVSQKRSIEGSNPSKGSKTSTCESMREPESLEPSGELQQRVFEFLTRTDVNDEEEANTSLHSVCKIYQDVATFGSAEAGRPKALDFISLLRKHGVGAVVRTNASNEEGLREIGGSYDPAAFREQDIHQLDFFVKDVNGGIPPPGLIRSFLQEVDSIAAVSEAHAPAVVVHCKSGFGRSVLFACLLVIHRQDVPGRALLGWARMVRPGAFTVPEQERFLCSFGGREDLHRHVGLAESVARKCCCVQ